MQRAQHVRGDGRVVHVGGGAAPAEEAEEGDREGVAHGVDVHLVSE